jgi:hypothetical protein
MYCDVVASHTRFDWFDKRQVRALNFQDFPANRSGALWRLWGAEPRGLRAKAQGSPGCFLWGFSCRSADVLARHSRQGASWHISERTDASCRGLLDGRGPLAITTRVSSSGRRWYGVGGPCRRSLGEGLVCTIGQSSRRIPPAVGPPRPGYGLGTADGRGHKERCKSRATSIQDKGLSAGPQERRGIINWSQGQGFTAISACLTVGWLASRQRSRRVEL